MGSPFAVSSLQLFELFQPTIDFDSASWGETIAFVEPNSREHLYFSEICQVTQTVSSFSNKMEKSLKTVLFCRQNFTSLPNIASLSTT